MSIVSSHRLGQVDQYAEADPDFDIPPLAYRQDLDEGDLAMLLDEFESSVTPLWAEIERVLGPGWYLGRTEDGSGIEFGAQHIADIERPRGHSLGAWYDIWRPRPERERPPVTGVFRHFARGGTQPGSRPQSQPQSQQRSAPPPPPPEKKGGFFDWFRKKPKVEIGPIPAAERREYRPPPRSFLRLPGVTPPPPVTSPPEGPQEPAPGPTHGMIVSEPQEGPPGSQGQVFRPSDELFQVLEPRETLQAPPGGMIIGPGSFGPAQVDAFGIPEEPYGPPGMVSDPFAVLPAESSSVFDVLEAAPEDLPPGAIITRQGQPGQISTGPAFDVREAEGGLSVYEAPAPAPTVFTPLEPERQAPAPSPKAAPAKKRKKAGAWRMPTRDEWVRWIKDTFDLEDLWKYVRSNRESDGFIEAQNDESENGDPPVMPIETWADGDWERIFDFFGIPDSVWSPYIDNIKKEEDEVGYFDEAWEAFNVELLYPLSNAIREAFDSIKPKDIPGRFILEDDGQTGTWGLLYYEPLPEEALAKHAKERRAAQAKLEKEQKEEQRQRKAELKRIWGGMPKAEDIVPWIEERYDLDRMFADIKRMRKTKQWKEDNSFGDAGFVLEVVADLSSKRAKDYGYDIASYFGIPPDVVTLYQDANSEQDLWSEVFWPFFDNIKEAFAMLLPYADLPGEIVVDEDDEDQLAIQYREPE